MAPLDVKLTETDVVQPDVLFVRNEREEIVKEDFVDAGPDLVVEVVSEGTRDRFDPQHRRIRDPRRSRGDRPR